MTVFWLKLSFLQTGQIKVVIILLLSLSKKIAPDIADYESGELNSWSGFRPLTPSSYPIIGPTSKTGLHINSGQGFYGWTLACASGKKLAEYF